MNHWQSLTEPAKVVKATSYAIVKAMPVAPVRPTGGAVKTPERLAMEQLEVGDGFWITDPARRVVARNARKTLTPKGFTVQRVAGQGWQVRRIK